MANARLAQIKRLKNNIGSIPNEAVINSDVIAVEKTVNADKGLLTIVGKEIKSEVKSAYNILDEQYQGLAEIYARTCERELEVLDATKKHTSSLKDKAGQISIALARIEKIVGPDFEKELDRLERFAKVVETLDALNKSGVIERVVKAMQNK